MATTIFIKNDESFQPDSLNWQGDAYHLLYTLQCSYQVDLYKGCRIGRSNIPVMLYTQVQNAKKINDYWHITLNLPGLFGPLGVLPKRDQNLVAMKDAHIKESNSAFFDIFHHELTLRSYESWLSHRLFLTFQDRHRHKISTNKTLHPMLMRLAGGFFNRTSIDEFIVSQSLVFRKKYISSSSLESLLKSYFCFQICVHNFSSNYHIIVKKDLSFLSKKVNQNTLGQDVRLGQSIVVFQNQIRMDIGPLMYQDYKACLPGGDVLLVLKKMIEKIVPHHIEVRAKLIIAQCALPKLQLKESYHQLGRTAWLGVKPILENKDGCSFSIC